MKPQFKPELIIDFDNIHLDWINYQEVDIVKVRRFDDHIFTTRPTGTFPKIEWVFYLLCDVYQKCIPNITKITPIDIDPYDLHTEFTIKDKAYRVEEINRDKRLLYKWMLTIYVIIENLLRDVKNASIVCKGSVTIKNCNAVPEQYRQYMREYFKGIDFNFEVNDFNV